LILLVEFDALHREMLRRLLKAGLPDCEVLAAGRPDDARRQLDKPINLLISRTYFPDRVGNPDFDVAATLFNEARQESDRRGEELPIIAMTTSPDDDASREVLDKYGFPTEDVEFFDIVATRPKRLVEKAAQLLGSAATVSPHSLSP